MRVTPRLMDWVSDFLSVLRCLAVRSAAGPHQYLLCSRSLFARNSREQYLHRTLVLFSCQVILG